MCQILVKALGENFGNQVTSCASTPLIILLKLLSSHVKTDEQKIAQIVVIFKTNSTIATN